VLEDEKETASDVLEEVKKKLKKLDDSTETPVEEVLTKTLESIIEEAARDRGIEYYDEQDCRIPESRRLPTKVRKKLKGVRQQTRRSRRTNQRRNR